MFSMETLCDHCKQGKLSAWLILLLVLTRSIEIVGTGLKVAALSDGMFSALKNFPTKLTNGAK